MVFDGVELKRESRVWSGGGIRRRGEDAVRSGGRASTGVDAEGLWFT